MPQFCFYLLKVNMETTKTDDQWKDWLALFTYRLTENLGRPRHQLLLGSPSCLPSDPKRAGSCAVLGRHRWAARMRLRQLIWNQTWAWPVPLLGREGAPRQAAPSVPVQPRLPGNTWRRQCSGPTSPGHHPLAASLSDTREVWGDFAFLIQPSFSQYSEHYSP